MGFWKKIKTLLGIARKASPDLDDKLKQAEQLHNRAEQAREVAQDVGQFVDEIRNLTMVGDLFSPGDVCAKVGQYVLVRDGSAVTRWSGAWDTCDLDCGDRYPPGQRPGDLWQQMG